MSLELANVAAAKEEVKHLFLRTVVKLGGLTSGAERSVAPRAWNHRKYLCINILAHTAFISRRASQYLLISASFKFGSTTWGRLNAAAASEWTGVPSFSW